MKNDVTVYFVKYFLISRGKTLLNNELYYT